MTLNEFGDRVFDRETEVLDTLQTLSKINLVSAEMSNSFLFATEDEIDDWVLTHEQQMCTLLVHTVRLIQACGFDLTDMAYAVVEE